MDKIHFHLPGAFEYFSIYNLLIPIYKNEKNKFYDYANIDSISCSSNFFIWSDCREIYEEPNCLLPNKTMKDFYEENDISISILANNLLLDENDLYNATANYFVNSCHNSKNEIIIGNRLLKALVDELYPNYIKISSANKCLSKEDTLNELQNGYDRIILNPTLNKDFEFLYKLNNEEKSKIEICLNPTCTNFCGHNKEHFEALSHDSIYRENTARKFNCEWQHKNFIERLNSKQFIKNDELMEKYVKMGFYNFNIVDKGMPYYDILYTITYFLVKPEYHLEITYRIISEIIKQNNMSEGDNS